MQEKWVHGAQVGRVAAWFKGIAANFFRMLICDLESAILSFTSGCASTAGV